MIFEMAKKIYDTRDAHGYLGRVSRYFRLQQTVPMGVLLLSRRYIEQECPDGRLIAHVHRFVSCWKTSKPADICYITESLKDVQYIYEPHVLSVPRHDALFTTNIPNYVEMQQTRLEGEDLRASCVCSIHETADIQHGDRLTMTDTGSVATTL